MISILFCIICNGNNANTDSLYHIYRYNDREKIFEVYDVYRGGKYQLIETIKLKNKKGRTFFVIEKDTIYTGLTKQDILVSPPYIQDTLSHYDFDIPFENGFVDVTFMCVIDEGGRVVSNAVIYPGSSFVNLDFEILRRLKNLSVYWEPAKIKNKNVKSIIIGKYNFIVGDLKWLYK